MSLDSLSRIGVYGTACRCPSTFFWGPRNRQPGSLLVAGLRLFVFLSDLILFEFYTVGFARIGAQDGRRWSPKEFNRFNTLRPVVDADLSW